MIRNKAVQNTTGPIFIAYLKKNCCTIAIQK